MARVVVIGAGMAGLAAAARLARLRHDVVLCEQADGPGGQAGRHERDGFAFDTGPTLLHLPATYRDLFVKTGKTAPLEAVLDLEPVDPAVRWRFADGTVLDLPNASRAGAMDAIGAALGPEAAQGWDAYVAAGGDIWSTFRQGFTAAPSATWRASMRGREGRARAAALCPARSLESLASAHLRDPLLRQAAGSYALRLGSEPRRAAALIAIWPYVEQTFGVWRVVGGIHRLVDAVAERAQQRGARLRYGCAVRGIDVAGGAVTGVRLASGERLPADIVVAAVMDATALARLMGRQRTTRQLPRQASPAASSASAMTVLLALRGEEPAAAPTVLFPADPAPESAAIFRRRPRLPEDPTVWLTPATAPAGHNAWTAQVTAPRCGGLGRGAMDWDIPGLADGHADRLISLLDGHGLDVSSRLLWREIRTPSDLERDLGTVGGAMAGPAMHGMRASVFRAPNATGVRGLFHVGASAHPGPGLSLAPLGAALVAEAVGRAR